MEVLEIGLIPFMCLIMALIMPITRFLTRIRQISIYLSIPHSLILLFLAIRIYIAVSEHGVVSYRFGGFPPPLGVIYIVDKLSATISLLASFLLVICVLYSAWFIDQSRLHIYYSLVFLLAMGTYGCLYTGDLFNFYVSLELVAVASYALTAFNSEKGRAVRAALIYGIFGTIMTSIYLLAVLIIYSSYGTVNIVDVMVKSIDPGASTTFSGGVYGDVVLTTKISMALITWVLFFKSGIMPNHFWLPEVYRSAPLPIVALFSASGDLLGIYGLIRLYYTVFTEESIISDFRTSMMSTMFLLGSISAILASAITMRQRNVRGLIAYSSITQYSLALLGVSTGILEGVAGAILHLVVNALGDALVLLSSGLIAYSTSIYKRKATKTLVYTALITGLLNLFGVIPVFPGFWSKAILTLSFIKTEMLIGTVVLLVSSGFCALGYFMLIIAMSKRYGTILLRDEKPGESYIPLTALTLCLVVLICLGLALITSSEFRNMVIDHGKCVFERERLLKTLP
ncbi:MAG: proton-conducting transporter membrane subunit [Desulfurococcaceae archaeon]